jgi:hypothetical protein
MLCQRYYEKSYAQGTVPGTTTNDGRVLSFFGNTTTGYVGISPSFKVVKRAAPTVTSYSPNNGTSGQASYYVFGTSTTNTSIGLYDIVDSGFNAFDVGTNCDVLGIHFVASAEL